MQSVTFGCGQGGSCSCGQGFGSARRHKRYPAIEGALKAYIDQQLKENRYFFLTPDLNSSKVAPSSFSGVTFLDPGTDPLSNDIAALASDLGDAFGQWWGTSPPSGGAWNDQAQPPWLSNLPAPVQAPVTRAAAQDLFGVPVSGWLIGGGAALLLVVLATMPRGRRRAGARR